MNGRPSFHGLFMGVNRHLSPAVNELSFAERDATAMHALFVDTLGAGEILLGGEVTRTAVSERLEALSGCGPDDVVVISFSGHGSRTHELVTYDADPGDLAETAIPLARLTEYFRAIPARHLICILDCCFSGAMGAKVLQADVLARDLESEAVELDRMAGRGRLILTASTAQQSAWEYSRFRHGLLTHHLLEALQGAPEVREGERLPVLSLLQYVIRRVADTAAGFHSEQDPTLRGELDGELSWPVMSPGATWAAAFPELSREPVTADLSSLGACGFPADLIDAWRAGIPGLNALQQTAINDYGLLDGEHLLVSAPTSSGKTLIGELAALKGALEGTRTLFLLPLKALVNDKHLEFERKYGAYGIRTVRATGDFSDDNEALMMGRYDICLTTYEKATALAIVAPHLLDGVGTVVLDEAQSLVDPHRGAGLEFLMTMLRVRRRAGIEPQMIALSAVIGDSGGLDRWLGGRLLSHPERPVPLDEGVMAADGSFRWLPSDGDGEQAEPMITPMHRKGTSQDWIIPLLGELVGRGEQVIVFRNIKGATVGSARYLARALSLPPPEGALAALPPGDPSVTSAALREVLARGVGFHNADLDRAERLALEGAFRAGELKVLVATSTLAMGVNTPASTVVIAELAWWDGTPYTVATYKNMVGRAGRLGYAERGRSVIIAPSPRGVQAAWERYVLGTPEDLHSRFLDSDPRALILRTLAGAGAAGEAGAMDTEQVIAFLEDSWGVYQRRAAGDWSWDRDDLERRVVELERLEMIGRGDQGRLELLPLGRFAGEAGVDVESIVRLAAAAQAAGPFTDAASLLAVVQLTVELDGVYLTVNSKGWRKEQSSALTELQRRGVSRAVLDALRRGADNIEVARRAKRALGAQLWVEGVPRADIEALLMRHHRENAVAGAVQSTVNRTIDLLPTATRVLELVCDQDLGETEAELMLRLQLGIPAEITPLGVIYGERLSRTGYLALAGAGITTPIDLEAAGEERLAEILGEETDRVAELLDD